MACEIEDTIPFQEMKTLMRDCSVPCFSTIKVKEECNSDEDELQQPICVTLMPIKEEWKELQEYQGSDPLTTECEERNSSLDLQPMIVKEENHFSGENDTEDNSWNVDNKELLPTVEQVALSLPTDSSSVPPDQKLAVLHCSLCGKLFPSERNLKRHLARHKCVRSHRCDSCDKTFASSLKLKQHVDAIHTTNPEGPPRPHKCKECGALYRYAHLLRLHIRLVHTEERPFCCEECGAKFCDSAYLSIHRRCHEPPISCPKCAMTFKYRANLHKHLRGIHNEKVEGIIEVST